MITVQNINGRPAELPEGKVFGSHSDDNFFYFFETEEELRAHENSVAIDPVVTQPATDIPSLLKTQTPEQIAEIKQILGL